MPTTKLYFAEGQNPSAFKLIELPPELHDHFHENVLCIKGLPDDEAVLCTPSATFVIRDVQLSNSLLVINPANDGRGYQILDNVSSTIELSPCLPRLDRLDELLGNSAYEGPEDNRRVQVRKPPRHMHGLKKTPVNTVC